MGEQFFLSSEFENLVDLSALSITLFLIPLAWAGRRNAGGAAGRWSLALFFFSVNGLIGLNALRTGYLLASNLPFSSRYFAPALVAFENLAAFSAAALILSRTGSRWAGRLAVLAPLAAALSGLWILNRLSGEFPMLGKGRLAALEPAILWFGPVRAGVLLFAMAVFRNRWNEGHFKRVMLAGILMAVREGLFWLLWNRAGQGGAGSLLVLDDLLLVAAAVLVALTVFDLSDPARRPFAIRVFGFSFVVLATASLTLSFNYILRVQLLEEALVRYRGEGQKIAADIRQQLGELSEAVARLSEPSVFRFFSTRFHTSSSAVSELGLDLVRGYIPRDFQSVSFWDEKDGLLFTYARSPEDSAPAPALTESQQTALRLAPGQVFTFRLNQESRGPLIQESSSGQALRDEAVTAYPSVLFATAVRDRSGRIAGFVKAVVRLQSLLVLTAGYAAASGWDFIASKEGVLLAHSRRGYLGFQLQDPGERWADALNGKNWYQLDLPGGRIYLAFYQMEDSGWVIARAISTTTIIESTRKFRGATLLMLFITVLVAAVTAIAITAVLTRQNVAMERMAFEVERKKVLEDRNRVLDLKNRELAEERRRIEAILVSIGEGVVVLDPGGTVIFLNGAAERILGVRTAPDRALQSHELRLPDLDAQIDRLRHPGYQLRTSSYLCRVGETDVRVTLSVAAEGNDLATGPVVLAIQDITELMRVDRMKTEIISIVSHSLRTPLTSIKSFTEILQSRAGRIEREKELEYLGVIDRSTDRLSRIVNNLLDLSKVASGKMQYRFEPTDLNRLVAEAIELVSGAAESKGIGVRFQEADGLPDLPVDRSKFRQVLDNLLGNSLKFTPVSGTVAVTVEVQPGAELSARSGRADFAQGARYAVVRVKDSGVGIRKQNLERIFDKFFQDDYVRQSTEGGTGLGLAISREYVLAHHGVIWAEAPPEGGALLSVAIPLTRAGMRQAA